MHATGTTLQRFVLLSLVSIVHRVKTIKQAVHILYLLNCVNLIWFNLFYLDVFAPSPDAFTSECRNKNIKDATDAL